MNGYIKVHRKIIDWEWYTEPNVFRLFIHMLLKANHKSKKWRGISIESGQFISSRDKLAEETGLTVQNVRTVIDKLKSTSELTTKTTNKFTLYTLSNYKKYQIENDGNQQANQQLTNNQPTTNQQLTTNKNDKKEKNDKNKRVRFKKPSTDELSEWFTKNGLESERARKLAHSFWNYYESKGWLVGNSKMQKWPAAAGRWLSSEKEKKQKIISTPKGGDPLLKNG